MTTAVQEFWSRIVRINPGFGKPDDTKVTMTISTLRSLVNKAHRNGFHSGIESAKSLEKLGQTKSSLESLLEQLKGDK